MRSQQAVAAGIEKLAGALLGVQAKAIGREMEPLRSAIEAAQSERGLRRALGPTLLRQLGTGAQEQALMESATRAALIGRGAARPKGGK